MALAVFVCFFLLWLKIPSDILWPPSACFVTLLTLVPFLQYFIGLLPYTGDAWIASLYLSGFMLSIVLGMNWERQHQEQGIITLFGGIIIAGIVSIGIQLVQWLHIPGTELNIWMLESDGIRPYANLAQPNLLATLLLWSLLCILWLRIKQYIQTPTYILASTYFMIGLALTQSRMATIVIVVYILVTWLFRTKLTLQSIPFLATLLGLTYFSFLAAIEPASNLIHIDSTNTMLARSGGEMRLKTFELFLDAIKQRPLLGFGMKNQSEAHLLVASEHPSLGTTYQHAHNLFLDFLLWFGVPLGSVLILLTVRKLWNMLRAITNIEDAMLFAMIATVGWHAMLELPLHYATFLLPTGLLLGTLEHRLKLQAVIRTPRVISIAVFVIAVTILISTARDYLRIESDVTELRLHRAKIGKPMEREFHTVWIMNQYQDFLHYGKKSISKEYTDNDILKLTASIKSVPSIANIFLLTGILANHGNIKEAQAKVDAMHKITTVAEYSTLKSIWQAQSVQYPSFEAVKWP